MTVSISIRVSDEVYEALKKLSEDNHRSINGQVNTILENDKEVNKIISLKIITNPKK